MRRFTAIAAFFALLAVTAASSVACPLEREPCCPQDQVRTECILDCPNLAAADRTVIPATAPAVEPSPAPVRVAPPTRTAAIHYPASPPERETVWLRYRVLRI